MTTDEKQELLNCYLELADSFGPGGPFGELASLDPELLVWRPFEGAWSIHEHVVHVFEGDMAAFHRYRKAIAEPGGLVIAYDEDAWTERLQYHATSLEDAIKGIQFVRELVFRHLQGLLDQDWTAWWFHHNKKGRVDLQTWLGMYVDHMLDHHEYVRRNLDAWRQGPGAGLSPAGAGR